ncbi:B-type flagellar hook-associated protein 2 [Malaciobacter pacificus]|jgi:flagellar hook-associated protein 2|uniref:Flagellar hook-associated protein 2 n=1 Tax=Malaciobacter pacificus TaxID=1080223 RepID=A0A5C2H8W6_9BACT|nr:flagellar filament capping protein FliD [Malaciobacter pacificus]QEP35377.1 flagellar filament cap protein [Malaciobacter pacificus]GGD38546.1 B-type flagellar hook-associated protein 2 [Malaciobacter pacificus]
MADGILGLGSGQAASLNQDLIDKLKDAERKATVEPIETSIEDITLEKEVFTEIENKVSELLEAIKPFDLFVSGGVNAFDEKSATTSGTSVVFDAADVSALNKGVTTVEIVDLAQKDVYQTNAVDETTKDTVINAGNLEITVNGVLETFDTTNLTYDQLAEEINAKDGMNASVQLVGTDSYRIVIKSSESGVDNALTISGAAATTLGLDLAENHKLTAQNMDAIIDGVSYSVSSNDITVDGLKISAVEKGTSSINVVDDTTTVTTQMQNFVTLYNELVTTIDDATGADSPISNRSGLREIVNQIKDKLFGTYGANSDKSIFNYGFELNKSGTLSIDETDFNKAIEEDMAGLKELFIGVAENEGLGTQLKAVVDEMNFSGGILSIYENNMTSRESTLEEDKTKAEEALDAKYEQLALQFSSYGAIINQMEASFSGLKLMIQQSTAS